MPKLGSWGGCGPQGRSPAGAKWAYVWKLNGFGEVTKAKARLVAKWFSQMPGVDFDETFAPTSSSLSVRLLVAKTIERDMKLLHIYT